MRLWGWKFIAKDDDNEKSFTKSEKDNQNQNMLFLTIAELSMRLELQYFLTP